ncbi:MULTISPECIES: ferredoxin family protein [Bacillus]|uniref:ferredoxin family protein n=1 Tax=Bacillus TaxID=1386 RepID=UPI0002EEB6C6|nr:MULTISPECIES: ferredoxin family protein [Bacillus]
MSHYMSIEEKLAVNKFHVDEENAHIEINHNFKNKAEMMKLVKACPAGLYKLDDNGTLTFDYAGCLECGTCRVLSKGKVVSKWDYPVGSYGIEFRLG